MRKTIEKNSSASSNYGLDAVEVEYDAVLDSKKRITIRGDHAGKHVHVKKFKNGVIVLEPRELVRPSTLSEKSLEMLYSSLENFDKGIVSEPIDLDADMELFQ